MSNQQTNINAAGLLGHEALPHDKLEAISIKLSGNRTRLFNIFAGTPQGAYDREQVVIVLDETHSLVVFFQMEGSYAIADWKNEGDYIYNGEGNYFKTRNEAIAAAVNEVMK